MAEERIDPERRRRDAESLGRTAIGGDGVAAGLGAELGLPREAAGRHDPAMAGAKPAMLGVYDAPAPGGRFGALGPVVLVLAVIGVLLLLAYAVFAAHDEAGAPRAAAAPAPAGLAAAITA
jgi:hypothetical protein